MSFRLKMTIITPDCIIHTDNLNHPTHFGISCLLSLFCSLKGNKTQRQVCLWQCQCSQLHSSGIVCVTYYFIFSECLWKFWLPQPWKLVCGRGGAACRDRQLPSLYLQQHHCLVFKLLCAHATVLAVLNSFFKNMCIYICIPSFFR